MAKRKVLLINPKFQLSFLAFVLGMATLVVGIFYSANVYFFSRFNEMGKRLGLTPDHVFFQFINEQAHTMNWIFGVTSLVCFVALVVGGLVLSHWVAGPIHRLMRHMSEISEGKSVTEVKFRKHDYFPELAEAFNKQRRVEPNTSKDQ